MSDADKSKKQLIEALDAVRRRVAELEGTGPGAPGEPGDAARLHALYAIVQTVSQTLNLDELLRSCLDTTAEAVRADAGAIYLLDGDRRALTLRAQKGLTEKAAAMASDLQMGDDEYAGMLRWKDAGDSPSGVPGNTVSRMSAAMPLSGKQSLAAIPLLSRGQVRGALLLRLAGRSNV